MAKFHGCGTALVTPFKGDGSLEHVDWLNHRRLHSAAGDIAADDLQPWKARVLLMSAMTITKDVTEIQQLFEHNWPRPV